MLTGRRPRRLGRLGWVSSLCLTPAIIFRAGSIAFFFSSGRQPTNADGDGPPFVGYAVRRCGPAAARLRGSVVNAVRALPFRSWALQGPGRLLRSLKTAADPSNSAHQNTFRGQRPESSGLVALGRFTIVAAPTFWRTKRRTAVRQSASSDYGRDTIETGTQSGISLSLRPITRSAPRPGSMKLASGVYVPVSQLLVP